MAMVERFPVSPPPFWERKQRYKRSASAAPSPLIAYDKGPFWAPCRTSLRSGESVLAHRDTSRFNQLSPFRSFTLNELREVFRRAACNLPARVIERLDDFRLLKNLIESRVQLFNDFVRGACRRHYALPVIGFKPRKASFRHCRNIRQQRQALCTRHSQRTDFVRLNGGQGRIAHFEHHADMTGHQISCRRRATFIGNVSELNTCVTGEQSARKMVGPADSGRTVSQFTRILLCQLDQFLHIGGRNALVHVQEQGAFLNEDDGLQVG